MKKQKKKLRESDSFLIYMHTNLVTGKSYVGYTGGSIEERWGGHVWSAFNESRNANRKNYLFQHAIKKHGSDVWVHRTLIDGLKTVDEACELEIKMIAEMGTLAPDGYNQTKGGHGVKLTEEGKERHRIATKEALNRPDVKARVCAAQKKSHNTPEFRAKMSKIQIEVQNRPEIVENKRQRMKKFCSRPDFISPRARKVAQFDKAGNLIETFKSATEASKKTKTNLCHLCEVARGLRKYAGGFCWKYVEGEVS